MKCPCFSLKHNFFTKLCLLCDKENKKRLPKMRALVKLYKKILQRFHINHKTVSHIAFQHSFVSFVDFLHFD